MFAEYMTVFAQSTYIMQNATVSECEGILLHSGAGENGNYDHNEDFTFTICVPGATEIILSFDYFATEQNYDVMTIYDGPDRMSPVLATLSGILLPAPTLVVTSGCVTIHFQSDDNITANGWRMRWSTQVVVPPSPELEIVSVITCPLAEVEFLLSEPIPCEEIEGQQFTFFGPGAPVIDQIVVLDCDQGLATRFKLVFNPPLGYPGNYRLLFFGSVQDACGREHPIGASVSFDVSNCPFAADIRPPTGVACSGACATLEATAVGENSGPFTYLWQPGGYTSASIEVCDSHSVVYSVLITDQTTGQTASFDYTYEPLEIPQILNPIADTICASAADWTFQTTIPGGDFFSGSIPPQQRKTGIYEFWRWSSGQNLHTDTLLYIAPNGCRVLDTIYIWPVSAGTEQSACLDAPTLSLNGGTPSGGSWTGPFTTANGQFSPIQTGTFTISYEAPNGCVAQKKMIVHDNPTILNPIQDTICASAADWIFQTSIPGGDFFSGSIPNQHRKTGRYEFWRWGNSPGLKVDTVTYITPAGCRVRDTVYILPISAGSEQVVCEGASSFALTGGNPSGGVWTGPFTSADGIFNPVQSGEFIVSYEGANGCIAQKKIKVNENPRFLNPIQDTICASSLDVTLQVSITGGDFLSRSIPPGQRKTGLYEFWRWSGGDTLHIDTILYTAPNGCRVRDTIYIWPIRPGDVQAACLNAPPFPLLGGGPEGGTWSGMHTNSTEGSFNPVENGTFWITYEAPNGCTAQKQVHVADSITLPVKDTLCTEEFFLLQASPPGGRWSGPGIVNPISGRLEAWKAPFNEWHTYTYTANGCEKTMQIYIIELTAGPDITQCIQNNIVYLPYPGNWSGPGVFLPSLQAYDVSGLPAGQHTYRIKKNICEDAFVLNLTEVSIEAKQALLFCPDAAPVNAQDYVRWSPTVGDLQGPGISWNGSQYIFDPVSAGPGVHTWYYEALDCTDSITVEVASAAVFDTFSFCDRSLPVILTASPAGGRWSGPGFLQPETGLFDPKLAGVGIHEVLYTAPNGCVSATEVEVTPYEAVFISGIQQQYCFQNRDIQVQLQPAGGDFTINGQPASPVFNPASLGTGTFELKYTKGSGPCASSDRKFIQILPPIEPDQVTNADSICSGQQTVIQYKALGGVGTIQYTWDQGLGFGNSHIVRPTVDTWYRVTVTDQCSDPLIDSVFVRVFPAFNIQTLSGPPVCYGEETFAEVMLDSTIFDIWWQTTPPVKRSRLYGTPGTYSVEVLNTITGCRQRADINLPGSPPVSANFSLIPNQDCIDIIDNEIEIIDNAFGYSEGWLDFGDGSPRWDLNNPGTIRHMYSDTGQYILRQWVVNELGCEDFLERTLCVRNKVRIFVPDVFTPNDDKVNDVFEIFAFGIKNVRWQIYNRYGGLVFEADDAKAIWDGTLWGKPLDPDTFVFNLMYEDRETGKPGYIQKEIYLMK